jgi:hypothetical protein
MLVVDGSGHGAAAARAAEKAVAFFLARPATDLPTLASGLHASLAPTRGAALALVRIETRRRIAAIVGIGNIAATLVTPEKTFRMVSHNGTAGHIAPRIREFTYSYSGRPLLIMHSDGIGTRWDLGAYPGLATLHPSLVAGILFRDFRRPRDDATVVVLRAAA